MKIIPAIFEERGIRRLFDEKTETWFCSVVDIVQVLTQQPHYKAARNYWKVLKNRLAKEGRGSRIGGVRFRVNLGVSVAAPVRNVMGALEDALATGFGRGWRKNRESGWHSRPFQSLILRGKW